MQPQSKLNNDDYQRAKQAIIGGHSKTKFLSVNKFKPKRVGNMILIGTGVILVVALIVCIIVFSAEKSEVAVTDSSTVAPSAQ